MLGLDGYSGVDTNHGALLVGWCGGCRVVYDSFTVHLHPAAGRYARGFLALCCAPRSVLGFVAWWRVGGFSAGPFANCKKVVLYLRAPFFSTYKRMRKIHRMIGRRSGMARMGGDTHGIFTGAYQTMHPDLGGARL